jgi:hypothetical protein
LQAPLAAGTGAAAAPWPGLLLTPAAPPPSPLETKSPLQGRYVSLGICKSPSDWRNLAIVAVLVGGFLGVNSTIKSVNKSTTDRKRKKALAEIEKEEVEKDQ